MEPQLVRRRPDLGCGPGLRPSRWNLGMKRWIVLVALSTGCVPTSPVHRSDLHDELVQRTGHGIGEEPRLEASIPKGLKLEDGLTEDEAVTLALWNNPQLQATLTRLGVARGDLYQAGALPNPVLWMLLPLGPKQLEVTFLQSIAVLWQRPYRVEAASLDVQAVAATLVSDGLETVKVARGAFNQLYLAQERLTLLHKAADTWQRMAELAQIRLNAGAASQLEVTAVATDARAAQLEANRQSQRVAARRAELGALLGLFSLPIELPNVVVSPALPVAVEGSGLVKAALAARPEVRAAELRMEAAGARIGLAKAEVFDFIVSIDANGSGSRGFELGPGAQFTLPIFYQNQGAKTRAKAEMTRTTWNYLAVTTQVRREVEVAQAQLTGAIEALSAWPTEVVKPLQENVERAQSAYVAGGATYLQVLETTRRLITAQLQGLELEREARIASIQLARSLGGRRP
jgi:cobalt-zinc-cadmium efflux system outer membrane protein